MRVLVTGARGFLGGAVVDATLRRGHDVRVLVRPRQSVDDRPWGNAVSVAAADLRHDDLAVALDEVDVVVHLAARVLGSPEERFASTVAGTERLLAALPGTDVRRVLLASTISVYDFTRGSAVIDEDHPVEQNLYARDPYAVAKVWQERVAREACDGAPWDLVTLRPGMIWGRDRGEVAGAGQPLGGLRLVYAPRWRLPLTYVENCADLFALAATDERAAGVFNVVDGHGVTAWRYVREWVERTGEGSTLVPLPYGVGRGYADMATAISKAAFHRGGKLPSVMMPRRFEARFRPLEFSGARARSILGWVPPLDFPTALDRAFG